MANYKAKFISGDPNDVLASIIFELYRDDKLISKYQDASRGTGFVGSYTYKKETKEIYIEALSYFYTGSSADGGVTYTYTWGKEGTKYNLPVNDIEKNVKINIEGYTFSEAPAPPANAPAKAPTGNVLKFVEDFNKEFDKDILSSKSELDEGKLILASYSSITSLKYTMFPEDNPSIKTLGDLYKYCYDIDNAIDRSIKLNGRDLYDSAKLDLYKETNSDLDGKNLTPKQDLSPGRKKIESAIWKSKNANRRIKLKEPQGKNPSLWSPGLSYFEEVHYAIKQVLNSKDLDRYNAGFSISYNKLLREGKETFSYSIASFTRDGGVNGLFSKNDEKLDEKYPEYKQEGYKTFYDDDGQFGYQRFYEIFRSAESGQYSGSIRSIAEISVQQIQNYTYLDNKVSGGGRLVGYPSLRTPYLSGKVGDFESNMNFQTDRGDVPDEDKDLPFKERRFFGNLEFMSLYNAIVEAGDDYVYVTFPVEEPPPPAQTTTTTTTVAGAVSDTNTSTTTTQEPRFIFNVEDEKTFFCKEPAMELHIVPATNDVPQVPTYRAEETGGEEVLEDEYNEIEISYESIIQDEFNSHSADNINQVDKTLDDEPVFDNKQSSASGNTNTSNNTNTNTSNNTNTNTNTSNNNTTSDNQSAASTETLKPTKKGYLLGTAFKNTQAKKDDWAKVKTDNTYRLTGFKFGKPKITEKTFIDKVKSNEGGIANGKEDSAYRTYKDTTVVPVSKEKYGGLSLTPDQKSKFDQLCYSSYKKERLYDVHTSKGILWLVFKKVFGNGLDAQERFLAMNDADWWKIMKERFYDANKSNKIKSSIAGYFWTYMCWGSGAGGAISQLNMALNLLSKTSKFKKKKSISEDLHIKYMNELYASGKEDELISAMYDVVIQQRLNISQPGDKNNVYRVGWVAGINRWIEAMHEV